MRERHSGGTARAPAPRPAGVDAHPRSRPCQPTRPGPVRHPAASPGRAARLPCARGSRLWCHRRSPPRPRASATRAVRARARPCEQARRTRRDSDNTGVWPGHCRGGRRRSPRNHPRARARAARHLRQRTTRQPQRRVGSPPRQRVPRGTPGTGRPPHVCRALGGCGRTVTPGTPGSRPDRGRPSLGRVCTARSARSRSRRAAAEPAAPPRSRPARSAVPRAPPRTRRCRS